MRSRLAFLLTPRLILQTYSTKALLIGVLMLRTYVLERLLGNQSFHPDGAQHAPPRKETCFEGKKEGKAVRRTGSYGSWLVVGQEARPSSQSKLE
jgi:hypothetical protein